MSYGKNPSAEALRTSISSEVCGGEMWTVLELNIMEKERIIYGVTVLESWNWKLGSLDL